MRFKVDENLPSEAADLLMSAGHDALTVLQQNLGGEPDPKLAVICNSEARILLTLDLDFADIRVYPPSEHVGIIVLRPATQDKSTILALLRKTIGEMVKQEVNRCLWIVDEAGIRIRGID